MENLTGETVKVALSEILQYKSWGVKTSCSLANNAGPHNRRLIFQNPSLV